MRSPPVRGRGRVEEGHPLRQGLNTPDYSSTENLRWQTRGYSMKPLKPVRRFDVFAEYNRLEKMDEGMPPHEAKGYALWVAKGWLRRNSAGFLESLSRSQKGNGEREF